MSRYLLRVVLSTAAATSAARAGSYVDVALCDLTIGCISNPTVCHELCNPDCGDPACSFVPPFAEVHPYGFTGLETAVELKVCVDAAALESGPTIASAIAVWEALQPVANRNCQHCTTWEGVLNTDGRLWAHSVILHELGHCALGLDHVERPRQLTSDPQTFENSSFTRSANAATVPEALDAGPDGVRGSRDDFHEGIFPDPIADSVSWFKTTGTAPNDPFAIDDVIIDSNTFSRAIDEVPPGDTWAASGNLNVALLLGYLQQQSVMYGLYQPKQYFRGLAADDVSMVKMARTSLDFLAGTADDYTVDLVFVGDCSNPADIRVRYGPVSAGSFGECRNLKINYSFTPPNPLLAHHFSVNRFDLDLPLEIHLKENAVWTLGEPIFEDAFESGDFAEWDTLNDGSGGEEDEPSAEEQAIIQYERQQDALVDAEVELLQELGLLLDSSDDQ